MTKPKGTNLTWHSGEVDAAARAKAHGHQGVVLWLTGLSGSGKSTLSHRVERSEVCSPPLQTHRTSNHRNDRTRQPQP